MRLHFVKNLIFIVGLNLLIKPIWVLAIDRNVQNLVGHASYGLYSALLNLAIVFQIFLDFGLNNYASRKVAIEPEALPTLFPALLGARLLLMILYGGVVMTVGYLMGYGPDALSLLSGTLMIQTLVIILLFIRSNVAALQYFRLDGVLSITDRSLMILVCGAWLFIPQLRVHFTISTFVILQIACYTTAICLGFYMLHRLSKVSLWPTFRWSVIKPVFRHGAPFALLIFLMSVYMRSDSFMLERLAGEAQAGIYATAIRLLDVGNMIAIIIAGVLLPLFGRMIGERQNLSPIIKTSLNLLIPMGIVVCATAWFFGQPIMDLLYTQNPPQIALIFALVMTAYPGYCTMYLYGTLLTAAGELKVLNIISAIAAAFSIVVNLVLIPKYGAVGAAFTSACTMGLLAFTTVLVARWKMPLQFDGKAIGSLLGYAALLVGIGLGLHITSLDWLPQLAIFLASSVLLMFPFQLLDRKGIMRLVQQKAKG